MTSIDDRIDNTPNNNRYQGPHRRDCYELLRSLDPVLAPRNIKMRLLKRNVNGQFSLTQFRHDKIPPYAILSHAWADEEVVFKDITDDTAREKLGYEKIRFCGEQASRDGQEYFWVDTCCIDKSSSAELQEAINSMFRWYQNAAVCYVYLADVSSSTETKPALSSWERAFRKSKWFTRGWTLQELIAPKAVEFFSKEGVHLGSKKSLESFICEITGIATKALQPQYIPKRERF